MAPVDTSQPALGQIQAFGLLVSLTPRRCKVPDAIHTALWSIASQHPCRAQYSYSTPFISGRLFCRLRPPALRIPRDKTNSHQVKRRPRQYPRQDTCRHSLNYRLLTHHPPAALLSLSPCKAASVDGLLARRPCRGDKVSSAYRSPLCRTNIRKSRH